MSYLCSTMIPSYKRPGMLMAAIKSFRKHAIANTHQAIVRLSDADPTAQEQKSRIEQECKNTKVIIGPHLGGYKDLGKFYDEMLPLCDGEWINIWDDDMVIEGRWDEPLKTLPKECIAVCECYTLGPSRYDAGSLDDNCTGWFMHRDTFLGLGAKVGFPPDLWGADFAKERGWNVHRLVGTRLNHRWQRPMDENR